MMRALRLEKIGSIDLRSVPEPLAADEELFVRVTAAGICGSDRHLISGEYPAAPPVTLGHEVEGIVEGTAPGTTSGGWDTRCHRPQHCLPQLPLLSHGPRRSLRKPARSRRRQGRRAWPSSSLSPSARRMNYRLACPPVSAPCANHWPAACGRWTTPWSSPATKWPYWVAASLDSYLAQLARVAGGRVVLVTRQRQRRQLAESLGAVATVDPLDSDAGEAIAGPGGFAPGGVDVAFEAAGVADTFRQALGVARHAGKVVVVGAAPTSLTVPISPFDLFARELQVIGSHLNPLTHGRAVEMATSGLLDLGPLITRTVDLGDVKAVLTQPVPPGEVKVQVVLG